MGCLDIPNETVFTMEMTPIIPPAQDFFLGNLHNNGTMIFRYIVYSIAKRDLVS